MESWVTCSRAGRIFHATAPPTPDEEPEEDLGNPPDYTPFDGAGSIDPEQGGGSGEDSTVGIPPKADDGGGCGCRASSRGPTGHATPGLLLMLLLTVLRVWGYRHGVQSD
ncbi:MAG TPA: hypothetical protein EYN66_23520 [Myxococcales bacterium]|nr:hypothetical protein [Myxococcales bacterium]